MACSGSWLNWQKLTVDTQAPTATIREKIKQK